MLVNSLSRLILGMTVSNIFSDNLFNNMLPTNFMLMLFSIEKRIKVASNYSLYKKFDCARTRGVKGRIKLNVQVCFIRGFEHLFPYSDRGKLCFTP